MWMLYFLLYDLYVCPGVSGTRVIHQNRLFESFFVISSFLFLTPSGRESQTMYKKRCQSEAVKGHNVLGLTAVIDNLHSFENIAVYGISHGAFLL